MARKGVKNRLFQILNAAMTGYGRMWSAGAAVLIVLVVAMAPVAEAATNDEIGATAQDVLSDRDYQRAFNRASMCIPQILKKVHFDPEKPENHNVVISSMNNKYIKLHDGQKWNLRDREETVEDLFADAEDLLETKLESWQEEENPKSEKATRKYQIYLEVKEKAELYKKIKQELKLLLFNNRNLITAE